jgi:hypothetical protein
MRKRARNDQGAGKPPTGAKPRRVAEAEAAVVQTRDSSTRRSRQAPRQSFDTDLAAARTV